MPLFSTHTHTPNQVNQFTRPSIIRARLPLRHHGAPTPSGAIPVTPFRNALLINLLLRASPAAVSSARLAAINPSPPSRPQLPLHDAFRLSALCSTVPNAACSPPAPQASTRASAAAERAPSCAEGGGRGIKEQPVSCSQWRRPEHDHPAAHATLQRPAAPRVCSLRAALLARPYRWRSARRARLLTATAVS
ncbi:hypothetical protein T492DRAFT_1062482, partial [Pavlovales sp. CCMP2436]